MKAAASLLGSIGNGCIYTPSDSHEHSCSGTHDHTSKRFGTRSIVRSSDHSRNFVALSYNTFIVQQSHKDAGFTDCKAVILDRANFCECYMGKTGVENSSSSLKKNLFVTTVNTFYCQRTASNICI